MDRIDQMCAASHAHRDQVEIVRDMVLADCAAFLETLGLEVEADELREMMTGQKA